MSTAPASSWPAASWPPSGATPEHFAAWAGIGLRDARERFARLTLETMEVDLDGRAAGRDEDMAALQAPPPPRGLRLLPAEDPFLAQRDRATLLPDRRHQAQVWEAPVRPGVVLWDGWPVATWQAGTQDRTLVVDVSPLADRTLDVRVRRALDEEAAGLAIFYMCDQAQVEVLTEGPA